SINVVEMHIPKAPAAVDTEVEPRPRLRHHRDHGRRRRDRVIRGEHRARDHRAGHHRAHDATGDGAGDGACEHTFFHCARPPFPFGVHTLSYRAAVDSAAVTWGQSPNFVRMQDDTGGRAELTVTE